MTSSMAQDYARLRRTPVAEWDTWIGSRRFDTTPFHWWRALMESGEYDMRQQLQGPGGALGETLDFIVEALAHAVRSGAWRPPYATGTLCMYAKVLAEGLTPDGAARQTVDSFTLAPDEALDVARRGDAVSAEERSALQDIRWAWFFLQRLAPFISSPQLADSVRAWSEVEARIADLP